MFLLARLLEFVQAQFSFFLRLSFWFFFQFSSFSLLKKANSTIEQHKCKVHEKRDRFHVSKVELNFQISQRNKNLTY